MARFAQELVPLDHLKDVIGLSRDDNSQDEYILRLLNDSVAWIAEHAKAPVLDTEQVIDLGDEVTDPMYVRLKWVKDVSTLRYTNGSGNVVSTDLSGNEVARYPDGAYINGPFPTDGRRYRLVVTRGFDEDNGAYNLRWVLTDMVKNRYRDTSYDFDAYMTIARGILQ